MQVTDAMEKIVTASGQSWRAVSNAMGRSDNYLSAVVAQSRRKAGDVRSATLASVANACGYALALVPVDKLPDGAIAIDAPSKDNGR